MLSLFVACFSWLRLLSVVVIVLMHELFAVCASDAALVFACYGICVAVWRTGDCVKGRASCYIWSDVSSACLFTCIRVRAYACLVFQNVLVQRYYALCELCAGLWFLLISFPFVFVLTAFLCAFVHRRRLVDLL